MRITLPRAIVALAVFVCVSARAQTVTTSPFERNDEPLTLASPAPPMLSFVSPDTSLVSRPDEVASPTPDVKVTPAPPPRISMQATDAAKAQPRTTFRTDAPSIIIRWRGENLPIGANVRVAWVAEDVGGVVEPGFVIDQSSTEIETPVYAERFTISRPRDGWAPGKYRVDLYVDDELKDTLGVTIRE